MNDMNMNEINNTAAEPAVQKDVAADRRAKRSVRVVAYTSILLAIVVLLNLITLIIPQKYTIFDISQNGAYTEHESVFEKFSDVSVSFAKSIDKDVKLYLVCEDGNADPDILTFIEHYTSQTKKITYEIIDPLKKPDFVKEYSSKTLADQSIIVKSDARYYIIDAYDLYYWVNPNIEGNLDYFTYYQYASNQYYSSLVNAENTDMYFNGETVFATAIEYVTLDETPQMYFLSSSGGKNFDKEIMSSLDDSGISYGLLDLDKTDKIPTNCSCMVINDLSSDITAAQATLIKEYLDKGGNMLLFTNSASARFENLMSVMAYYGLGANSNIVCETDDTHYNESASNVLGTFNSKNEVTSAIQSSYGSYTSTLSILMPNSHSITVPQKAPEKVTVTNFITTTDKGYLSSSGDKIDGTRGTHVLAVSVEKELKDNKKTSIIWLASTEVFSEETIDDYSLNSVYLPFITSYTGATYSHVASIAEDLDAHLISDTIYYNSEYEYLKVGTLTPAIMGIVFIGIIPLGILIAGIVVFVMRKKK